MARMVLCQLGLVGLASGRCAGPLPRPPGCSGAALETAALAFGEAAPDSEALVVFECVFKALGAHLAGAAHLLGFPGGATLLREERLRISLGAQRAVLPRNALGFILADTKDVEPEWDDLSHGAPPFAPGNPVSMRTLPGTDANYTSEITRACLASRQAGSVILIAT